MSTRGRAVAAVLGVVLAASAGAGDRAIPPDPATPDPDPVATAAAAAPAPAPALTSRAAPGPGSGRSPAPTAAPTTTTTAAPATATIVATGDVLLHSPLWDQAAADAAAAGRPGFDFAPLLAGVRPVVEAADLAVCHLETPIAPAGGPYAGYPAFNVPPEIAPALATTGYDACTTASNHAFDRGADGVDRTLDALDAAGIAHAGSARDPAEAQRVTLVDAGEATVALLSYSYGFNGVPAPNGEMWRANGIDEATILADAATARGLGADIVVVALHWGDEYVHDPNTQQSDLAPRLIRSPDVDLLLGHHAHVVQPLEQVDGEWVVYGMGNLVARHGTPGAANEEGIAVRVTFRQGAGGAWHAAAAEYEALLMVKDRSPQRLVAVEPALADPATDPSLRARLEVARDRTAAVVASRGATAAGLSAIGPSVARAAGP